MRILKKKNFMKTKTIKYSDIYLTQKNQRGSLSRRKLVCKILSRDNSGTHKVLIYYLNFRSPGIKIN